MPPTHRQQQQISSPIDGKRIATAAGLLPVLGRLARVVWKRFIV